MNKVEYIPGEEWRDISGYEGLYQVSNYGNVQRLTTKAGNYKPHLIKPTKTHSGLRIHLCKDNYTIGYMLDRIVAQSFVKNKQNKEFVYHKDGNIMNNYSLNLLWVSEKDAITLCIEKEDKDEMWKDITGFENLYRVSSLGRVKSLPRIIKTYNGGVFLLQDMIIKQFLHDGYPQVRLCKEGKMYSFSVHRLVATAFVSNPLLLPEVNHKDEIKSHNVPSNLEWCTKAYNIKYGTRTFRTSKPVDMYDLNGNYIKTFMSIHKASEETNIPTANIGNCAREAELIDSKGSKYKVRTAGGYIWKYADKKKLQHLLFGLGLDSNIKL